MSERARCSWCGDVIGVYEPMLVVTAAGGARVASAANERFEEGGEAHELFHRACYELAAGDDASRRG